MQALFYTLYKLAMNGAPFYSLQKHVGLQEKPAQQSVPRCQTRKFLASSTMGTRRHEQAPPLECETCFLYM